METKEKMVGKEITQIEETIKKVKENNSLITKRIEEMVPRLMETEEKLKKIETLCELSEADGDHGVSVPAIRMILEGTK